MCILIYFLLLKHLNCSTEFSPWRYAYYFFLWISTALIFHLSFNHISKLQRASWVIEVKYLNSGATERVTSLLLGDLAKFKLISCGALESGNKWSSMCYSKNFSFREGNKRRKPGFSWPGNAQLSTIVKKRRQRWEPEEQHWQNLLWIDVGRQRNKNGYQDAWVKGTLSLNYLLKI